MHAALADLNAGACAALELNAFLNSTGEVGSGKLDTPCERMHRENLTVSCWTCCSWAWVGGPPEVDGVDERGAAEPQAAITAAATTAAAAAGIREVVLNMTQ